MAIFWNLFNFIRKGIGKGLTLSLPFPLVHTVHEMDGTMVGPHCHQANKQDNPQNNKYFCFGGIKKY